MFPPAASVICGTMAGLCFWDYTAQKGALCQAAESACRMAATDDVQAVVTDCMVPLTGIQNFTEGFIPSLLTVAFYATVLAVIVFMVGIVLLRRNAPPRRVLFTGKTNNFVSVSYLRYRYGKHLYCLGLLALFCVGFWHGLLRQIPTGALSGIGAHRSVVAKEDSLRSGRGKRNYELLFAADRSVIPEGEQVFLCLRVTDFPVHVTTGNGREYMRMECRLVLYSPDGREQIPGYENIQAYILVDSAGRGRAHASDSGMKASQWLPGDILFTRCRSFPFTSNRTTASDTATTGPNAITTGSNANPASTHPDTTDLHEATTGSNANPDRKDNASDSAKTNTTTFDYSKYMARRGFFRRAYIYNYKRVAGKLTVFERLKRLRVPITKSWEGEAGALLSGICLGDKTGLAPEMRDRFSAAGAGHILAVSGLHVGILYGSLVLLLGLPLRISESRRYRQKRSRRAKKAGSHQTGNAAANCSGELACRKLPKPATTETFGDIYFRELYLRRTYSLTRGTWIHIPALLLIWTYAGVVGFSASIVRAALMLSVYGIGKMTGRRAFGLNVLSLAALILVIVEPLNLYDIGFQMSFCAVLGLILFFPLLRNLLSVRNRPLKYIWELFCCSMAVQLGTLWLTTASFGIIPLYGLFCNLAVVPFCTVILYVFVCYLILLGISVISGMNLPVIQNVNDLLYLLAGWLENTVYFFAGLPLTPIHYQPGPGGQILMLLCTAIVYILLRRNDRNL